ncbi:hypothetical protein ACFOKI_15860 [Sphingomonas qilianensis]|uniref:Uncharacterized protein n=1 Tax=Sphingomonas qilianensis TaxID=1736690 RepID=A0ABU9XWD7_9SPHN
MEQLNTFARTRAELVAELSDAEGARLKASLAALNGTGTKGELLAARGRVAELNALIEESDGVTAELERQAASQAALVRAEARAQGATLIRGAMHDRLEAARAIESAMAVLAANLAICIAADATIQTAAAPWVEDYRDPETARSLVSTGLSRAGNENWIIGALHLAGVDSAGAHHAAKSRVITLAELVETQNATVAERICRYMPELG